ncbi:MAG: hypothetical protein IPJ07_08150 [Acidobacteria bacterium]|nr:hypothetical protein [Acidobacteriota bacterium]
MEAGLQELVAFHLTGKRAGTGLEAIDELGLRPALFSGYRDLTQLRYDFPLVLVRNASADRNCVQSLSGIIDGVTHEIAKGDDGDRLTQHALRVEQKIRSAVAAGEAGRFWRCGTRRRAFSRRMEMTCSRTASSARAPLSRSTARYSTAARRHPRKCSGTCGWWCSRRKRAGCARTLAN